MYWFAKINTFQTPVEWKSAWWPHPTGARFYV
jgi:hypothetical protein